MHFKTIHSKIVGCLDTYYFKSINDQYPLFSVRGAIVENRTFLLKWHNELHKEQ